MNAIEFAISKHNNQTYGNTYYIKHLIDVNQILLKFKINEFSNNIITAGWLHDTLEDTNTSYNELVTNFGEDISNIVYNITNEIGKNRKEKWEKTKTKISTTIYSVILKVADRIANIEYSIINNNKQKLNMYLSEREDFNFINIYYKYEFLNQMWEHLNNLYKSIK